MNELEHDKVQIIHEPPDAPPSIASENGGRVLIVAARWSGSMSAVIYSA